MVSADCMVYSAWKPSTSQEPLRRFGFTGAKVTSAKSPTPLEQGRSMSYPGANSAIYATLSVIAPMGHNDGMGVITGLLALRSGIVSADPCFVAPSKACLTSLQSVVFRALAQSSEAFCGHGDRIWGHVAADGNGGAEVTWEYGSKAVVLNADMSGDGPFIYLEEGSHCEELEATPDSLIEQMRWLLV